VATLDRMASQKARRVKRRKEVRKEDSIRIRVTAEQKQKLVDAATLAGLGVSSWMLTVSLREAGKTE
jgi:uncharacterized protein (DUF1778 family)